MFRPGKEADEISIARLWRSAWMSANPGVARVEPLEHWHARVRDEFHGLQVTLFFIRPDRLAAFMAVDVKERYVHQLFVDPDCQGQGIGAQLLRQVCEVYPGGWSLHVAKTNVRARSFYARFGLLEGAEDVNLTTGRARVAYAWRPMRD